MQKLIKNTVLNVAISALTAVFALTMAAVVVRNFGFTDFGFLAIARILTPLGFLGVFRLGFGTVLFRKAGIAIAQNKDQEAADWTVFLGFLHLLVGCLLTIIIYLLSRSDSTFVYFIRFWKLETQHEIGILRLIFEYAAYTCPLMFLGSAFQSVLEAKQHFSVIRSAELFLVIINLLATLFAIFTDSSIGIVVLSVYVGLVLRTIYFSYHIFKSLPLRVNNLHSMRNELSKEWPVCASYEATSLVDLNVLPLLVSYFFGVQGVGVFEAIMRLPRHIKHASGLINSAILPFALSADSRNETHLVQKLMLQGGRLMAFFSFPSLMILAGGSSVVLQLFLGADAIQYDTFMLLSLLTLVPLFLVNTAGAVGSTKKSVLLNISKIIIFENILLFAGLFLFNSSMGLLSLFIVRFVVTSFGAIIRLRVYLSAFSIEAKHYIFSLSKSFLIGATAGLLVYLSKILGLGIYANIAIMLFTLLSAYMSCYYVYNDEERKPLSRLTQEIFRLSFRRKA